MRMRKNQKGYTIVELLIAVAILSIVVASVCGFILVGSRSYAAGNSDIGVQQEAQLALNQMSDLLIDTTRSVNYAGYDAGGNPVSALKDSEFTFTPKDKSLVMYNGVVEGNPADVSTQTVNSGNGNKHYHFYWSKDKETLYYAELDVQSTDVNTSAIHFPAFDTADPAFDPVAGGWVVLASHVTDFSADLSQLEEKRVVQLALTFVDGTKEYVTSNNVTIRNKVGVNDAELDPVNKKKTLSVAPRDSGVIIEPGETYHFSTPRVTGENVADRSVTWSLTSSGSPSGQTRFTDTANGILYVAEDEPAGTIDAVITTNAVDSDGQHASCPVSINIKRVTAVGLAKTADTNTDDGALQISPGCTFTISATVDGFKLGEVCSVCGDDTSIDKTVGHGSTLFPWHIHDPSAEPGATTKWNPTPYLDVLENEPDHATFYVHPDVPTSNPEVPGQNYTVVIQAASLLSVTDNNVYHRHYDPVFGGIELTFVKGKGEEATPINGLLQYGDETLIDEIKEDLTTEGHEYVTCIRVVDNSTVNPQSDKILLYFTIDHGANFRIVPDLFDLDLNRSYTFYMQALDPVSKENHKQGNHHQADSKQEIWNEYINHLNPSKPYGYVGEKYDYRKVYYSVLDKPRAIWDGYSKGKDITLDPINVYSVSPGSAIIGPDEVVPDSFENIWHSARTQERMTYSVYVGDGDKKDDWTSLYWYNGDKMRYEGSTSVGDGVGVLNIKDAPGNPGNPFFKMENGDKLKLCGNYHIVTGFCYNNVSDRTLTGAYDIIGWQGFSCDGESTFTLPHDLRHYTFDNSTIHVNLNADFTMEIQDDWFQGKVNFPLPKEMLKNPTLFPNPYETEWTNTSGSLKVVALQNGSDSGTYKTFAYVGYRYFSKADTWEVEPFEVRFDTNAKKIYTHSYGNYLCDKNGSKWEKGPKKGSTTEKDMVCNVKPFSHNNSNDYQAFFPLPTDAGFPFVSGVNEITSYELEYFDNNMQSKGTLSGLTVTCELDEAKQQCTIKFMKKEKASQWDVNNHKINVTSYGTYVWKQGETIWTRTDALGNRLSFETDFVPTLKDLKLPDGNTYMMDYPLPGDSDFQFKKSGDIIKCNEEKAYDQINDAYAANVKYPFQNQGIEVEYTVTGGTHTVRFYKNEKENPYDNNNHKCKTTTFGIYEWTSGSDRWNLRSGSAGQVETGTDFIPTLRDLKLPDGNTYMMDYPLPGGKGFPFTNSGEIIKCSNEKAYDQINDAYAENVKYPFQNQGIEAEYTVTGGTHTIRFYKKEKVYPYDNDNHMWKTTTYGIYEWTLGSDMWNLRSGSAGKVDPSTDFVPTMFIRINNTDYKVHFPLPSESAFDGYKNGETSINGWVVPLYEADDLYAERPKRDVSGWAKVNCTQNGDVYTLTISEIRYDGINNVFGTFTCPQNGTQWTKVN